MAQGLAASGGDTTPGAPVRTRRRTPALAGAPFSSPRPPVPKYFDIDGGGAAVDAGQESKNSKDAAAEVKGMPHSAPIRYGKGLVTEELGGFAEQFADGCGRRLAGSGSFRGMPGMSAMTSRLAQPFASGDRHNLSPDADWLQLTYFH
ncbi:hypothetical protein SAMN05216268_113154 [Streptomyces yunnanensis]|uniref:Uncharacterized protein n=1 Tax=Streptomyces yunnanensis TaxID=156453 RepID=A0A9X8N282_9ACTN|nr:hypothetical protein SAMN05216268_113154 [Streptomyces yunnanensis]